MALTNSTIDTINYAKDLDIEYNIKLIIFSILVIYSVVLLYFSFRLEYPELWQKILRIFIMQIPSVIFLFFLPLFTIYLFRTVSWELIYGLMLSYFTYLLIVILLAGNLGMFTYFTNMIGIDTKVQKMELKNK